MGASTRVDPGDLDDFGKRVLRLADGWVDSHNYPSRLMRAAEGDPYFPRTGAFSEADELHNSYATAANGLFTNFEDLYLLLEGLADAARRIAGNYRDGETLSQAKLLAVLHQHLEIPAGSGPLADAGADHGRR